LGIAPPLSVVVVGVVVVVVVVGVVVVVDELVLVEVDVELEVDELVVGVVVDDVVLGVVVVVVELAEQSVRASLATVDAPSERLLRKAESTVGLSEIAAAFSLADARAAAGQSPAATAASTLFSWSLSEVASLALSSPVEPPQAPSDTAQSAIAAKLATETGRLTFGIRTYARRQGGVDPPVTLEDQPFGLLTGQPECRTPRGGTRIFRRSDQEAAMRLVGRHRAVVLQSQG